MSSSRTSKGKKRARRDIVDEDYMVLLVGSSTSNPLIPDTQPVKKPKRAVTRKCPVCEEDIPVRLLDVHAELESERVNEIIQRIGSTEVLEQAEPDDGLTARTRRSALKARKSMSLLQPHASSSKIFSSSEATLEVIDKALKTIKRRRKQRNIKLREMTRDDEEAITGLSGYKGSRGRWAGRGEGDGTVCPVCIKVIQGDPDVVEAHVDACLVHQVTLQDAREREERERKAREAEERDSWEEIDVEGEVRIRVTDGATFQGMGFDVRDRSQQDVDDDVDIDGEDDVLYGNAQFTEGDILVVDGERARSSNPHTSEDDTGDSRENGVEGDMIVTLQDLVAAGKRSAPSVSGVATPVDEIVEQLQRTGDTAALIGALEARIRILESSRDSSSVPLLCRICIDPYVEPTVSTGCWHTCCRECWLRCLGSTKLCPICKRITSAVDLRRVFL